MKAKLSEKTLFGDSDCGEIKAAPKKSQKYLITYCQQRPEFANMFPSTHLEY